MLVSVLQGIAFTVLLTKSIPPPPKSVFSILQPSLLLQWLLQQYFYLPYILTSLILIIVWMNFVYASAVFIWPPTPLQAGLIFSIAIVEVVMANSVENFPIWRSAIGLTTVIGGLIRCNNVRIFAPRDFEDPQFGEALLRKERSYGIAYIILGTVGVVSGLLYSFILSWLQSRFPGLKNVDNLLHWTFYLLILGELIIVLKVDAVNRQSLLLKLTEKTDLGVTRYGGIWQKKSTKDKKTVPLANIEQVSDISTQLTDVTKLVTKSAAKQRDDSRDFNKIIEPHLVSHRDGLYRLWERGQWLVTTVDFTQDRIDWDEKLSNEQRSAILTIIAMFLNGEQAVIVDLVPFMNAASRPEDRIFLGTQLADECRHHIFFDRFIREVVGKGNDMVSTQHQVTPYLGEDYRKLFKNLETVTKQLHGHPHDMLLLTEALVLYHFVSESIAHAGQYFLSIFGEKTQLLPGFTSAIDSIHRDESRHIAFGLLWLQELIAKDPRCKDRAVLTLNRVLPWMGGIAYLPQSMHSLGVSHREMGIFMLSTLETRLKRIGISIAETPLAFLGSDASIEEKVDDLLILMDSGIFAKNEALKVSNEVMDVIFKGVRNLATKAAQHEKFSATIQWNFDEVEPRYLKIDVSEPALIGVGTIANPHLRLNITAADWIYIMAGKLRPLHALLSGRLRMRGDWRILLRLTRYV